MDITLAIACAAQLMRLSVPVETYVTVLVEPVSHQECEMAGRKWPCNFEARLPGQKIMLVRFDPRAAERWAGQVHAACHVLQVEHDLPYPAEWQCERIEERAKECPR